LVYNSIFKKRKLQIILKMSKTKVIFNQEKLDVSSEIMRALAHPLRLRILEFIDRNGIINVNKIYNTLKIEQSITSQHLKIMRLAGVIDGFRDGKYVHYTINYDVVDRAQKAVNRFLGK
jgi:DNA-binding transcriptional ArsR family regulator